MTLQNVSSITIAIDDSGRLINIYSGWKPTHLTSVFSLRASVPLPPDGTTLTAFTNVNTDVNTVVADVR